MKFKQVLFNENTTNTTSIDLLNTIQWLEQMGIKNYTINDDGTVDVDDDVNISNKNLTEIPIQFGIVKGNFRCDENKLTTLKGAPKYIGHTFDCSYNQLTTLQGAPRYVGGCFSCHDNKLTTLQGAPKCIESNFYCYHNIKQFSIKVIKAVCNVKGKKFIKK